MFMPPSHPSRALRLALQAACVTLVGCNAEQLPLTSDPNFYKVSQEDLPITVKEPGELQAVRETSIRSEVEGQATILYLVPEGTTVKAGDKLFELDVSEITERRATQEIAVEKSRNEWEQAKTSGQILEKELKTKHNSAQSELLIARMDLNKLLGSAGNKGAGTNADMVRKLRELTSEPQATSTEAADGKSLVSTVDPRAYAGLAQKVIDLLRTPEGGDPLAMDMGDLANRVLQKVDQIRLAMAELKSKEDYAAYSRRLAEKKIITRIELEKDELAYQSQVSKVTIAWNDLDLLINYELPADRIKFTQAYENAQLELQRVEASNDAERKKSVVDISAKEKELTVAAERLTNFNKQIKNAICNAPAPGLVVYARVDRDRRGGEAVKEGIQVRERQEIVILPDNSQMLCVVKVQEAFVDKVMVNQRAHVSVEAFPNEVLGGKVVRVAPVADSSSSWMGNDKKVYTTVIELDQKNADNRLRSRMAAAATITIATVNHAITVPQQAVRRDRSVNYVWKHTPQGPVAMQVRVGAHNLEKVQILNGVAVGDIVYRTPPGGVADPRFEQPVVPEPATSASDTKAPAEQPAAAQTPNAADGPGQGRSGRSGMGGTRKKFAEMTPEELDAYKGRLGGMTAMVDRVRETSGEEAATRMSTSIEGIRKALEANDLATAQQHADAMRAQMSQGMGQGAVGRQRRSEGGGGND